MSTIQRIKKIAATKIRNAILDNHLEDFFEYFKMTSIHDKPSLLNNINSVMKSPNIAFMEEGVIFESELIKLLNTKFTSYIKTGDRTLNTTIKLMKEGSIMIYQSYLENPNNNTFGYPDLLIRSDYINKIFNYNVINERESKIGSPKLNIKNYHYIVVDIKHSTIELSSDQIHINNSPNMKVNKCQLYIYTQALNNLLGINNNKAYVWGKKYVSNCEKKDINFLEMLGTIDYDNNDSIFIDVTNNALSWLSDLYSIGHTFTLLPTPSRKELYPNMKVIDGKYNKMKNDYNNIVNDITSLYCCGVRERKLAHDQKIYTWKDKKFNSEVINFKDKRAQIIDAMLKINNNNCKELVSYPNNSIEYERHMWHHHEHDNKLELFIDFETYNSNYHSKIKNNVILNNTFDRIFLIGIGYKINNTWTFKPFIMKDSTLDSEINIINASLKYINDLLKMYNKEKAILYHWSCAEQIQYYKFKNRNLQNRFNDSNIEFYDLNKVFISEPIIIKDALNYKLKTIGKALYKHRLIDVCWDQDNQCSNGLDAMILAENLYTNILSDNIINSDIMKDIVQYNEIDCHILCEIHNVMKMF
jgi:hypothetical protein